jgi:3-oxoacyl-[acyl-carrier protein] reductase
MSKLAVITGASKGIGAATVKAFANDGYDVIFNYNTDKEAASNLIKEANAGGSNVQAVQADIFTQAGVDKLFAVVKQSGRNIDVLVNNAGRPDEPDFGNYNEDAVIVSLQANLVSAILCTQSAVELMSDNSSILFTTSIYGLSFGASPALPLYSAGKAGIISFMQSMAEKLAPSIRCNAVAPGTTKTPAWDSVSPEYAQKSLDMTLQKEWVASEEIADTFVFLAKTPHITSQTIVVDAGWQKKIRGNSPKRS